LEALPKGLESQNKNLEGKPPRMKGINKDEGIRIKVQKSALRAKYLIQDTILI